VVEAVELPEAPLPDLLAVAAGAAGAGPLAGARLAVVDGDTDLGAALAGRLTAAGAAVDRLAPDHPELGGRIVAAGDGVLWLGSMEAGPTGGALPAAFAAVRAALLAGCRRLVVATAHAGVFGRRPSGEETLTPGAGWAGLVRTLALELPEATVRLVDLDPKDEPGRSAERLLAEMFATGGPPVVGYRSGQRVTVAARRRDLPAATGELPLDRDSVVLLTGGARGITARVAIALAGRTGCAVELFGRSQPPAVEDPEVAAATDAVALRRLLARRGPDGTANPANSAKPAKPADPAAIEAAVARILAGRQVRDTLTVLERHAASVRYTPLDVRDGAAVARAVAAVYARHGRIDGVVHGAGIVEDRLLADKTPESFARVFDTKVDGALALLRALRRDARFVTLFGSVAGVFGNRGQADYAAANDALDTLAHAWSDRFDGRVFSVDWGPWGGGDAPGGGRGMVSAELERAFRRRGVDLIDPDAGVEALLREIATPDGPAQVIYSATDAEAFGA
jgi:NAD(P)-dependent dehydrogenase (short-subunit alcohol dehydrogenase family)